MSAKVGLRTLVLIAVVAALLVAAHPAGAASVSSSYANVRVLGVRAQVVTIDLNDPSMSVGVSLSRGGLRTAEPFAAMVRRTQPVAAITGTFFCTRSLIPVGDIVVEGQRVHRGAIGACLAFTPDNKVRINPSRRGVNADWAGYAAGLRSGPQLISGGRIHINARGEGFRDRGLFGRRVRAAIGVTAHNKLLLVAVKTPVTFSELAKVMARLGAVDAVNLDGGSSTALYYDGKMLARPGRWLTNFILVSRRRPMPAVSPLPIATGIPAVPAAAIAAPPDIAPPPAAPSPPHAVAASIENSATLPEKISGMAVR